MKRIFSTKLSTLAVFALIGIVVGSLVSIVVGSRSIVSAGDGFGSRFHYVTTPADGATPIQPNEVINYDTRYNGTTYDLVRGNTQGTLLVSAARTATTTSADQTNYNSRGVQVVLNVTVASGTGGLQVVVQGKDPVSGTYYNLAALPTAITATGIKVYEYGPGASTAGAGDVAVRVSGQLPRTWRISVTAGDASSNTYSVGYALIN